MEDEQIIDLYFRRSEQAISETDHKYGHPCRKVSFNILRNREDTEECVNDTYLAAWNTIPPKRPDPFVAFLLRIVKNLSLKKYRDSSVRKIMDFTEKREDYGTSKSFTIDYGDEADYYYLVIDWEPVSTIRALTDHSEIGIADLPEEDREDTIVMQIAYENGREETCAISIHLTDDGKFKAEVVPYEVSGEDTFALNPDTVNVPAYNDEEKQETGSEKENGEDDSKGGEVRSDISEARLKKITEFAREYYDSLPYEVTDITPDYDETARVQLEYDGYDSDEILVLKVTVKDDEIPRYITIGSKDSWKNCTVLNEGY